MAFEEGMYDRESGYPMAINPDDITATFRRLRALDAACGPDANNYDRVVVLISACIEEGITEGKRIVGAVARLQFNKRFVGMVLTKNAGNDPGRHHWKRLSDGTYRLFD